MCTIKVKLPYLTKLISVVIETEYIIIFIFLFYRFNSNYFLLISSSIVKGIRFSRIDTIQPRVFRWKIRSNFLSLLRTWRNRVHDTLREKALNLSLCFIYFPVALSRYCVFPLGFKDIDTFATAHVISLHFLHHPIKPCNIGNFGFLSLT